MVRGLFLFSSSSSTTSTSSNACSSSRLASSSSVVGGRGSSTGGSSSSGTSRNNTTTSTNNNLSSRPRSGTTGSSRGGSSTSSMFFQKLHDYNQNVTFSLPRKVKHPSIRRFFVSGKTRKKEKECGVPCQEEYRPYLEEESIHEKITDIDLDNLCRLPPSHDKNEWLATHTISFFEHVNLMYGTVSEYCTSTGCSAMNGPRNAQYMWFDEKGKKCKCAAPQYVDYVMTFSQKTIQDEAIFPSKYGNAFPSSFESIVKKIHRYLFHVIAHLYQSHFKEITCLKLHGHLNTLFQHFMTFNKHFSLLEEKETEVLDDLYHKLEEGVPPTSLTDDGGSSGKEGGDPTADQGSPGGGGGGALPGSTAPDAPSSEQTTAAEENKENDCSEANQDTTAPKRS